MGTLVKQFEGGDYANLNYADSNLRLTSVEWFVSEGLSAHVTVFHPVTAQSVVDTVIVGPDTGSSNVGGNWPMQWSEPDPEYPDEEPYIMLPDGIVFQVSISK